ncbi:Tetratricopeptide-like helical domain-containing protein [Dioscorea alata]|uniref:Tetratricopeptide-like helical domain-containing protein n=1 Tax=Dioscorea alata TaxID=55571 RepID=A0ACB7VI17_DIOAL|nr:Tetratricopeptide-like helical domain-containing protein [Dioscorea alata]
MILSSCTTTPFNLFDEMPHRDVPSLSPTQIQRCAREGRPHEALSLFRELALHCHRTREPCQLPISSALNCCASLGAVKHGKELHGFMIKHWTNERDACCSDTSLVSFYAKCGVLASARQVFDRMPYRDVVSWTVILMAYVDREGCDNEVTSLLQEMLSSGITPNRHTITVVIQCATLEQGKQLHAFVVKKGWSFDAFVGSALVDLYSRNGMLSVSRLVFDGIEHKDVVCYNSLISGYGCNGSTKEETVSVFIEMVMYQILPNQSTFISLLSSCASFGFLGLSKQFHAQAVLRGFGSDDNVQAVIIDMYAKCGDLKAGRAAFDRMGAKKNIVVWNSMICGYGKHGHTIEALEVFNSMASASVSPNQITFTCLLSACSHSGFIDEGWKLFDLMTNVHGIAARNEHYCCIIDLLGRAGMVRKAYDFILSCDHEPEQSVWGALLNACVTLCDAEIGEIAARKLFELEPGKSAPYVALASIFAAKGRFDEAAEIRELMNCQGIIKGAGYSWIEIGGAVHKFRAGKDMHCAEMKEILSLCCELNSCISDQRILNIFVDAV